MGVSGHGVTPDAAKRNGFCTLKGVAKRCGDLALTMGVRENAAARFALRVLDLGVEITPALMVSIS